MEQVKKDTEEPSVNFSNLASPMASNSNDKSPFGSISASIVKRIIDADIEMDGVNSEYQTGIAPT